jgi:hypothetical protein
MSSRDVIVKSSGSGVCMPEYDCKSTRITSQRICGLSMERLAAASQTGAGVQILGGRTR